MTFHDAWRKNRNKPLLESPRPESPLLLEINQAVVDYVWDNFNVQNAALNKFFGGKLRIVEDLGVKAPNDKLKKIQNWIIRLTDYSPDPENPDMLLITYHNKYTNRNKQKRIKLGKYLQKLADLSKKIDKLHRAAADIIEKSRLYKNVVTYMRVNYGDQSDTENLINRMSMPVFARLIRWIEIKTLKSADPQEITARIKAGAKEASEDDIQLTFNQSQDAPDVVYVLNTYLNSYMTTQEPELYNQLLAVIVKVVQLYLTASAPGLAASRAFMNNMNSYSIYSDEVEQLNDILTIGRRPAALKQVETFIKEWPQIKEEMASEYLKLVISRHPIDVVRMSDFPHIQSCHSQGSSFFKCALAEAQGHGLVAYAITSAQYNKVADRIETGEEIFADKQRKIADSVQPLFRLRGRQVEFDFSILEFDYPDVDVEVFDKLDKNNVRGTLIVPELRFYGIQPHSEAAKEARKRMIKVLQLSQQDAIKTLKTGFQYLKDHNVQLTDLNQIFSLVGGLEDSNTSEILKSFFARGTETAKDIPQGGLGSKTDQPSADKLGLTQQFEYRVSVEHILRGLAKTSPVEIIPFSGTTAWAEQQIQSASRDPNGTYQINIKIPDINTDKESLDKITQIFLKWSKMFNKTSKTTLKPLEVMTHVVFSGENYIYYDEQKDVYTLRLNIYSGFGRYETKRNPTDEAVEQAIEATAQLLNAMIDDISNIVEEIQRKFN